MNRPVFRRISFPWREVALTVGVMALAGCAAGPRATVADMWDRVPSIHFRQTEKVAKESAKPKARVAANEVTKSDATKKTSSLKSRMAGKGDSALADSGSPKDSKDEVAKRSVAKSTREDREDRDDIEQVAGNASRDAQLSRLRTALSQDAHRNESKPADNSEVARMQVDEFLIQAYDKAAEGRLDEARRFAQRAHDLAQKSKIDFAPDEDRPIDIVHQIDQEIALREKSSQKLAQKDRVKAGTDRFAEPSDDPLHRPLGEINPLARQEAVSQGDSGFEVSAKKASPRKNPVESGGWMDDGVEIAAKSKAPVVSPAVDMAFESDVAAASTTSGEKRLDTVGASMKSEERGVPFADTPVASKDSKPASTPEVDSWPTPEKQGSRIQAVDKEFLAGIAADRPESGKPVREPDWARDELASEEPRGSKISRNMISAASAEQPPRGEAGATKSVDISQTRYSAPQLSFDDAEANPIASRPVPSTLAPVAAEVTRGPSVQPATELSADVADSRIPSRVPADPFLANADPTMGLSAGMPSRYSRSGRSAGFDLTAESAGGPVLEPASRSHLADSSRSSGRPFQVPDMPDSLTPEAGQPEEQGHDGDSFRSGHETFQEEGTIEVERQERPIPIWQVGLAIGSVFLGILILRRYSNPV